MKVAYPKAYAALEARQESAQEAVNSFSSQRDARRYVLGVLASMIKSAIPDAPTTGGDDGQA